MIPDSEADLETYRALRQGAWHSFDGNVELLRDDLSGRSIWDRIKRRAGREAQGMADEAVLFADDHKGWLALGVVAAVGWFARHRLMDLASNGLDRIIGED